MKQIKDEQISRMMNFLRELKSKTEGAPQKIKIGDLIKKHKLSNNTGKVLKNLKHIKWDLDHRYRWNSEIKVITPAFAKNIIEQSRLRDTEQRRLKRVEKSNQNQHSIDIDSSKDISGILTELGKISSKKEDIMLSIVFRDGIHGQLSEMLKRKQLEIEIISDILITIESSSIKKIS